MKHFQKMGNAKKPGKKRWKMEKELWKKWNNRWKKKRNLNLIIDFDVEKSRQKIELGSEMRFKMHCWKKR